MQEVALGPMLKVKEASPTDAEEPQTSPRQGASSPISQLLAPLEGDLGGGEGGETKRWELGGYPDTLKAPP